MLFQSLKKKKVENKNQLQDIELDYKKTVEIAMKQTYFMACVKKCISDFNHGLNKEEKICLSKCSDRAYDYLVMGQKYIQLENVAKTIHEGGSNRLANL